MLRRASASVPLALFLLVSAAGVASAFAGDTGEPPPADPAPVTPEAGGGGIAVTVTSTGTTGEGRTFSTSVESSVVPDCWRSAGPTGYEYYEYWKPGGPARESRTLEEFAAQGLLHKDYELYATETEGRWYEPRCRYDIDGETQLAYLTSHPAVFVMPGDPPPPADVVIDPRQLVEIAQDEMQLPTGTIHWNPSLKGSGATLVNLETWVWVEGAPETVSVTASVPGVWARVDATLKTMTLSAPENAEEDGTCTDLGTPYSDGMTSSSCYIVFTRSTANQDVKPGQTLPTVTLTATTSWAASWVSSTNPNPTPLEVQSVSTTAEVPVAEVQSVVTG